LGWGRKFGPKKAATYNNERVTSLCRYGFSHRSKLERALCDRIWEEEQGGEIEHLEHESSVTLGGAKYRCIPDFKLRRKATGEVFYREAKGHENPRWPTTKKQWKAYGPAPLEIYKGSHTRLRLDEVITPNVGVCPTCGK
jgi:hypothetical protein